MENKKKKLVLGNYAVARGAFEAGAVVATAYPGTPSTEITEFLALYPEVKTEWSPNEKVALEVAMGSAIAGGRAICCMKHVGLNVAADPLFSVSYTGINAGLVVVVADDPGQHSSQNEQDTRFMALAAKVPLLEPSDSQEALEFTKLAFELSEEYDTPVIVRLTTRVSHSQSFITESEREKAELKPYVKDIRKYVVAPVNAKLRRLYVDEREKKLNRECNVLGVNREELNSKDLGVVTSGIAYQYVKEALGDCSVFKAGIINPLPVEAIRAFSKKVKKLLVVEELDGFIENTLKAAGIECSGKDILPSVGELSANILKKCVLGTDSPMEDKSVITRPPMLCAGCPHRAVFAVLKKLKLNVFGDIGCYTLGASPPLSAMDTSICMGASIGMAIGAEKARGREFAKKSLAVIGDSTFIHSGITGLIDAVYNNLNTKVLILDNSTTGMTGHQPHPGTGRTITGEETYKLSFPDIARACGVQNVTTVSAVDTAMLEKVLLTEAEKAGVSVIIAVRPCALIDKVKRPAYKITEKCKNCKACVNLGCPAIINGNPAPYIERDACTGCGLCPQVCKFGAITQEGE